MTGKIGTPSLQPKSNFRSFVLESRFYSNWGSIDQREPESGVSRPENNPDFVLAFELCTDHKFAVGRAPAYVEQVGFAADLAVLDVLLVATR